jgi:hypothetical protein
MLMLSAVDLHRLTGFKRRSEQARWLAEQGIPFRDMDGRLVVLQPHVVAWMEGRASRSQEPRLDLVR